MRSGYPSKKVVGELVDLVELGESFSLNKQENSRRNAQVMLPLKLENIQ